MRGDHFAKVEELSVMGLCFSRADHPVNKQRMESKMANLKVWLLQNAVG